MTFLRPETFPRPGSPPAKRLFASAAAVLLALLATPTSGQTQETEPDTLPRDSTELRKLAEERQRGFESFRGDRIPPATASGAPVRCDERIGRFCLRHEGDEAPIPDEPVEVSMARGETLQDLRAIGERIPGDGWVLGQRIFYMMEAGSVRAAEGMLRRCEGPEPWWCAALLGYVLHMSQRFVEADSAFRTALAEAPDPVSSWYRSPAYVLDPEGRELWDDADRERRGELWQRLWLLSDPLYLVAGNDRLTAHYARRTLTRIRDGAFTAYGIPFDDDLEELNVRYGQERGYERVMRPPRGMSLQDTRSVIGRHHPKDREYLPTGSFLADPAEIPPGAWTLEEAEPRSGYAAPYALDMAPLESQVARFRRGDSLLVVASYRPASPAAVRMARGGGEGRPPRGERGRPERPSRGEEPTNPFLPPPDTDERNRGPDRSADADADADRPDGPVTSGLFLIEWDGARALEREGSADSAVVTVQVPNDEYVLGLEVHESEASRAWRTRQGVRQDDLALGQSAVSDLLFLEADGNPPRSLEEALPRVMPSIRVSEGEAMTVAWEIYGLLPGESADVTLGFTAGEPSFLERVGEFLRLVEPEQPVAVRFREEGPERMGDVFRALNVEIPGFEPGVYTLNLEVELPGRTPMVTSRRLVVEPGER